MYILYTELEPKIKLLIDIMSNFKAQVYLTALELPDFGKFYSKFLLSFDGVFPSPDPILSTLN